jgi:SAM-dependent methyltransferase
MLEHVMGRAAERWISNVSPQCADARALLCADAQFDAAYLVTLLGEIPERLATLMELRQVTRPGGRLVVGEFADRHHAPLATPVRLAKRFAPFEAPGQQPARRQPALLLQRWDRIQRTDRLESPPANSSLTSPELGMPPFR